MPKMPYDPAKDIAPITLVVRVQEVLVVSTKLGINDFKGFIAYAKANPGKLTCGSAGTGGITHLATELFEARGRHRPSARALSRRRARDQRPDLPARSNCAARHAGAAAAHQVRRGEGAGGRPPTRARCCCPTLPTMARAGPAQGQLRQLVRPGGAGRSASLAARQKIHRGRSCRDPLEDEVADAYAAVGGVAVGDTPARVGEPILRAGGEQMGRRSSRPPTSKLE